MSNEKGYVESSGNVFADLGLADAAELQAKADLAYQIGEAIEQRGLTQSKAADLLGIDQPKVSALMRGRLSGFSMERLYRYLNALGRDVQIVVRPVARGADASVHVRFANTTQTKARSATGRAVRKAGAGVARKTTKVTDKGSSKNSIGRANKRT